MQSEEDIDWDVGVPVRELSDEEWYQQVFERQAQRLFGMSGEEFARAYHSGQLDDHPNHTDVEYVAMLMLPVEHMRDQ